MTHYIYDSITKNGSYISKRGVEYRLIEENNDNITVIVKSKEKTETRVIKKWYAEKDGKIKKILGHVFLLQDSTVHRCVASPKIMFYKKRYNTWEEVEKISFSALYKAYERGCIKFV